MFWVILPYPKICVPEPVCLWQGFVAYIINGFNFVKETRHSNLWYKREKSNIVDNSVEEEDKSRNFKIVNFRFLHHGRKLLLSQVIHIYSLPIYVCSKYVCLIANPDMQVLSKLCLTNIFKPKLNLTSTL